MTVSSNVSTSKPVSMLRVKDISCGDSRSGLNTVALSASSDDIGTTGLLAVSRTSALVIEMYESIKSVARS